MDTPVRSSFRIPGKNQPARGLWWRLLLSSLALYVIGVVLMILTQNPNLFPTVVLIGSFSVPAAYVGFFYDRRHWTHSNLPSTVLSFIYGGILGVFAASILEPIFIRDINPVSAFAIGFIEEFAKILGVVLIARRFRHTSALDGLVLGAAAGMGFAAFESMGYAFSAFLDSGGSLSFTVGVTMLRALLSPLGHGTWTAILTAVLFRESVPKHFRISRAVLVAYITVSVLHGLWDLVPTLLAYFVTSGIDIFLGQAAVGLAGLVLLWRRWVEARRLERESLESLATTAPTDGKAALEETSRPAGQSLPALSEQMIEDRGPAGDEGKGI